MWRITAEICGFYGYLRVKLYANRRNCYVFLTVQKWDESAALRRPAKASIEPAIQPRVATLFDSREIFREAVFL